MILTQSISRTKLAVALAMAVFPITSTTDSLGDDAVPSQSVQDELPVAAKNLKGDIKKPKSREFLLNDQQRVKGSVVAHWRFQKGLDGSAADSSQLIEDSSGNDHHGSAIGGPKYRSVNLPQSNLALAFDGYDDRIFVADHADFHLTRSFTIEAYIEVDFYPESAAKECHIVFRGDNRNGFDPWFLSVTQSGQLRFLVADALNEASIVQSPEPLPTGKLLHVAATLDNETGKQSLFVNGKRVATTKSKTRAGGALGGTGAGIGIGNRQQHSNQAFRGTIDELRITAAALWPDQLLTPPRSE